MYSLWNTEQNPSLFSQEKFWTSRPLSCHYACSPTDPINFNYFLHSETASKRRGKNILNPSIAYSPDIKLKDLDVMLNLLLTDYYVSANKCIWEQHILGRARVALSPSCAPEREETMIFKLCLHCNTWNNYGKYLEKSQTLPFSLYLCISWVLKLSNYQDMCVYTKTRMWKCMGK